MARLFPFSSRPNRQNPCTVQPKGSATPEPRAAFASYNRHRRACLESQIGERGVEALRMLPLLLHVNQPGLPGFVDEPACPQGIADYAPAHADLVLARRLFHGSTVRRAGILRPAVDLVAVMGSAGTIGFSVDSDLDVWVCHNRAVQGKGLRLYRQKVQAVEAWLNQHSGLEIHLFFQSTDGIRANDFGEADVEGCGSAMGALLKEEFYRTSVLLAGKAPFWWIVPPGVDPGAYQEHIERLRSDPRVPDDQYLDLGCVARVPLGELFGAAVWQIVKGWKSPFKSALKMGLLEKAVCATAEVPPLCETLKEQVLAGGRPDPYRLLFDEVLADYQNDADSTTQDLLARCFYLKSGVRLDPTSLDHAPRGHDPESTFLEYVRSWGWSSRKIRHLNEYGRWKFEWVQALGEEVDRYFLRTYKRIRSALDESGEAQRITPRDLTILGRKLQSVYRRTAHKVETLHMVSRGVEERSLSLYQETLPDGEAPWRLYRGRVTPLNAEEKEGDLLGASCDALELLVWAAQNRILGPHTRLLCRGVEREISAADLEALAQMLTAFVEEVERADPPLEWLLEGPRPTRLLLVPNLGLADEGLVEIGAVYATTWGETFYRRWTGPDAFRSFASDTLAPFLLEGPGPHALKVFVPPRKVGTLRGPHRRLHRELPTLASYLGGQDFPKGVRRRHLGPVHGGFFALERTDGKDIQYKTFPDREGMLRYLSGVGPYHKVDTHVESHSGDLAILKAVLDTAAPGMIDVFTLKEPDQATLFVVDEIGNVTHFVTSPEGEPYALAKLHWFLEGVVPDLRKQTDSPLAGRDLSQALRIHTLLYDGTCRAFTTTQEHLARVRALDLSPVGLTIEKTFEKKKGPVGYKITWGDETIRSGEVESPLAELRRRILQARRSGLHYDVFVTCLFLDEAFLAAHCGSFVTTGHYLFYKKAIEQRLSS